MLEWPDAVVWNLGESLWRWSLVAVTRNPRNAITTRHFLSLSKADVRSVLGPHRCQHGALL